MTPEASALSESKRRLLERYLQGDLGSRRQTRRIPRRPSRETAPLSSEQELIWLHSQLAPERPLYNEILTVRRTGPLDVAALECALTELISRHENWRTTFETVDGGPVQIVGPPPSFSLPVTDLSQLPESEREPEALRLATVEAQRPIDIVRGPLVRPKLIRMAEAEHRLYLTLHQIIHDGVSVYSILLPELAALYEAFAAGQESPLPELPIQYGDFAAWQRREERPGAIDASLDYWRRQLAGAPSALDLPTDRARPIVQSFCGRQVSFALPTGLTTALKQLSQREGSTLFMTLLAAFEVLLHRYSGQDDLAVGTAVSTRKRPELEGLLGVFLNTIVLRTRLSEGLSFRQLLSKVREVTLEGLSHAEVPFHRLVRELQPRRDPGRNPLFQVSFVLEPPMPRRRPGWNITQMDVDTGVSRVDLYLQLDDRPEGLVGHVRYNGDLWLPSTIARMVEHFQILLEGIVKDPAQPIAAIPMLMAAERTPKNARPSRAASNEFVPFEASELDQSIAQRFAKQVAKHRDRVAVRTDGMKWTYGELDEAADRVAHGFSASQIGRGAQVALLLDQDAPMVAGILGVLKSGAAYVPLDPTHPPDRLRQIAGDSLASAVLTSRRNLSLAAELTEGAIPIVAIEDLLAGPRAPAQDEAVSPDQLAYLLYTSGSTGRPKGVAQNHRNVLHFIAAYTNNLHIYPNDRLTVLPSYSVDAAIMDIFGALLNGAALCIIDVRGIGLHAMRERLTNDEVTIYHSTPTLYRQLVRELRGRPKPAKVRLVVLGGEATRPEDVDACRQHFPPGCILVNGFGPTESTVSLQCFIGRQASVERRSVPIGFPVERTRVSLLSRDGRPGQVYGEIAIQSPHVAMGYWQRPELTSTAFLSDAAGGNDRIYKTGDMGRLLPDGSIEYCGRRDLQAKIHGFRVELGEIEATLSQFPGIKDAALAVRETDDGEKRLVAYFVSNGPADADMNDRLRRFLASRLPGPMVPSAFVRLDALPLTPSGKLDRLALPMPGPSSKRELTAPRGDLERGLLEIWKDVLGTEQIGIRDDFFDLGGHSLLALQMVAEIESKLGVRLPLAALVEAPTIERLAEVLRPDAGPQEGRALVAIQPKGALPPLFGVHGHSGEVLFYRELSQRLGREQPFFGLQAQGLLGKSPHQSIPEMAAHYLAEIRSVQPRGPYFIGGYCLGALVAYEMAQQLIAQSEEVALLALFLGSPRRPSLAERLRLHRGRMRGLRARGNMAYLFHKAVHNSLADKVRSRLWQLAYDLRGQARTRLLRNIPEANLRAARSYVPGPYGGGMTVFLSGKPPASLDPRLDLGGMTARELEVVQVPGDRESMLHEPFVQVLAEQLGAILDRTRNEKTPMPAIRE